MTLKEIAIAELDGIAKVVYSPEHATLSVVLCNNRKYFIKVTENEYNEYCIMREIYRIRKCRQTYL